MRSTPPNCAGSSSRRSDPGPRPASLRQHSAIPQLVATLTGPGVPPEASSSGHHMLAFRHSATGRHDDLPWSAAGGLPVRQTCPIWSGRPRATAPEATQRHVGPATTCRNLENSLPATTCVKPGSNSPGHPAPATTCRNRTACSHSATGRHADLPWSAAKGLPVRRTCPNWLGWPRHPIPEGPRSPPAPATTCRNRTACSHSATGRHANRPWSAAGGVLVRRT